MALSFFLLRKNSHLQLFFFNKRWKHSTKYWKSAGNVKNTYNAKLCASSLKQQTTRYPEGTPWCHKSHPKKKPGLIGFTDRKRPGPVTFMDQNCTLPNPSVRVSYFRIRFYIGHNVSGSERAAINRRQTTSINNRRTNGCTRKTCVPLPVQKMKEKKNLQFVHPLWEETTAGSDRWGGGRNRRGNIEVEMSSLHWKVLGWPLWSRQKRRAAGADGRRWDSDIPLTSDSPPIQISTSSEAKVRKDSAT